MSIGSTGEIGTTFTMWGRMGEESRLAWHKYMKVEWGEDLLGGYGTLCAPNPDTMRKINEEWQCQSTSTSLTTASL